MSLRIPLFPLNTVLFPEGPLPLRIFEPRYLDMVSNCLKTGTGIGVVLIQDGSETGAPATTHDIGTLGHINYWNRRSDGILGITVVGDQRFRILDRQVEPSQLLTADVELIPNEPGEDLPDRFEPLAKVLHEIVSQLEPPYTTMPTRYDDACWVGARLVELLPMELAQKQMFLRMDDPLERLERLSRMLQEAEHWSA